MSEKPEERDEDSKKVAEDNIEQQLQPEPLDKQDPIKPVKVADGRGGKTINIEGSNATIL
jgi:hypothetical protein